MAGVAQSHIYRLCVAGVAQPDIHLDITWQAWHNLTSTVVLRGRRATYGTGWRPWAGICRRGAAPLCVAGVAQPDIHLRFKWQAWHNLTSTVVSRGRRATYGTGWRPWAGICRLGAAPLCVAGVAQPDIHLRFTWQAWHNLTSTVVLRGRRGTYGTGWRLGPGFVAWAPRHFAWQVWHNLTSTLISRGRRGTNSHLPSFCVAGVPLMVLGGALGPGFVAGAPRHFAWQAWHNLTSTFVSRGRRGTISHLPSLRGRRGTHGFSGLFTHVMCRHVLWSLRHVVFSDLFSSSPRLFYIHTYIPTVLPSRSFTTSFVFPSFPVPAKTIEAHFRKNRKQR